MKLSTWILDDKALGYLPGASPSSPPPRARPKSTRPSRPRHPIPWRTIAKFHLPLGVALVAYELLRLAADLQPVIVATWASLR